MSAFTEYRAIRSIGVPGVVLFIAINAFASVIHVPGDQPTIQAGMSATVTGDTVLVADGAYSGDGNRDIDFQGRRITVMSENGPGACVLDLAGANVGFSFNDQEGSGQHCAGIYVSGVELSEYR